LQTRQGCDEQKQALQIADTNVAEERIGGQHAPRGKKDNGGVDKTDHDCNLEEIENNRRLDRRGFIGLREEKHHQDRRAIEAVEQAAGRFGQDGLMEQSVVGLDCCRKHQDHQDDDK
jgi:hypothetical protein